MRAAIYEPAITQYVAVGRQLVASLHEAEEVSKRLEQHLSDTRSSIDLRRLELGAHLNKVRATFPKRGTKEQGWGQYLEAIEVDEATAFRYMKLATAVNFHGGEPVKDKLPTYAELGLDKRVGPDQPDSQPPTDDDAPRRETDVADESGDRGDAPLNLEVEIDRNTWCTPTWITEAIGKFDLDPCSNDRSTVKAKTTFDLVRGENGLQRAGSVGHDWRVFINPPYSRGSVIQWVQAYAHVRFCFLLKFDPSTEWFSELFDRTALILIPRGTRVQFVPPVGVPVEKSDANQFPHALFYARGDDATDAIKKLCFTPWRTQ